jgi:hypothetical protein
MGNLMHSVALLEGFRFHTWELADSLEVRLHFEDFGSWSSGSCIIVLEE